MHLSVIQSRMDAVKIIDVDTNFNVNPVYSILLQLPSFLINDKIVNIH